MTLALYMGKSVAGETSGKLVRLGMAPNLPVGIVVNAGRPERSLFRTSLGDLATAAPDMPDGPAIIFIGESVHHGDWADAVTLAETTFKVA